MNNTNILGTQVTNNTNDNLGIKRSDGAVILLTPAPLKDKLKIIKRFYLVFLVFLLLNLVRPGMWAMGVLYLIILYSVDYIISGVRNYGLRDMPFAYDSSVGYDELFEKLMPQMMKKYGMNVEYSDNGVIIVKYQNVTYSIVIRDNNTFSVWWQLSLGGAMFKSRSYKTYKKNITMTAILAYEIQSLIGVNSMNKAGEYQQETEA